MHLADSDDVQEAELREKAAGVVPDAAAPSPPTSPAADPANPATARCPDRHKPFVLAATVCGSALVFIMIGGMNVALPIIGRQLRADVAQLQWLVNGYMLFLAALTLVGGGLGDRLGRRKVFLTGVAVYTLGSVLSLIAPGLTSLILARCVQGIGGALVMPNSLAILTAVFERHERGKAIGTWGASTAVLTSAGPAICGWLTDVLSWRAMFALMLPIAAAAWWLAWRFVPPNRDPKAGRIDWAGAMIATVALAALSYGLIRAGVAGWTDNLVLASLSAAVLLLVVFVVTEMRVAQPMLPMSMFRSPSFSGANLLTLLLYFGLMGLFFFLPLNLVTVRGWSAFWAGAAGLPFSVLLATLSRVAGGLADKFGMKVPLTIGPIISAIGFALMTLAGAEGSYWTAFFPGISVTGLGMALTVAPVTTAVMNSVPQPKAGIASGVNNAASRTAMLLSVALLGSVAAGVFADRLRARLAETELPPAARREMLLHATDLGALEPPAGLPAAQRALANAVVDAAFIDGFRTVMWIGCFASLAAGGAGLLLIRNRELDHDALHAARQREEETAVPVAECGGCG